MGDGALEALSIAAAFGLGLVVRMLGLPTLIGFLGAGFVLSALGHESVPALEHVAHLGILLLLFSVGLKLRFQSLLRAEVLGGALAHLSITVGLLAPALYLFVGLGLWPSVALAVAFGFSSTVVAAKILEQKRELRSFHGRVAIGILIAQDLIAVAVLATAGGQAPSPWALALFGLPLLRPLALKLVDLAGHDELLVLLGLLFALVAGGAAFHAAGLSAELGAIAMGALVAGHPRANELAESLWSIKEVFLVGFFLQIGLVGLPSVGELLLAVGLAIVLPIKVALFFGLFLRFRMRARSSFLTAVSLGTYSEFGLIVADLGSRAGWLDHVWVVRFAVTVAVSFVVAAPFNRRAHELYERLAARLASFESDVQHPDDEPVSLGSATFLVMGMGRIGTGAYDLLTKHGVRVVGLDSDPGKVQRHAREGRRVLYGDAEDPGFWQALRLDGLDAILLAMPDVDAKRMAAVQLRRRCFAGTIAATTTFPEDSAKIREAGCAIAHDFYGQAGAGFAREVLHAMGRYGNGSAGPVTAPDAAG